MEEFITKFVNLQHYVPYLKDETEKVYQIINCLPLVYKDKIEFGMPKNIDEVIRKAKLCYLLFKQISELSKTWQNKKNEKWDQHKKGFKPSPFRKEKGVI